MVDHLDGTMSKEKSFQNSLKAFASLLRFVTKQRHVRLSSEVKHLINQELQGKEGDIYK